MAPNKRKCVATANFADSKKTKKDDYTSSWFEAVADYVRETQTTVLDLSGRRLGKEVVQLILNILPNSEVTELNLMGDSLRDSMTDLAPLLTKTKIKKLNVSEEGRAVSKQAGRVSTEDLLVLFEVLKDTQITDLSVQRNWNFSFNAAEARKVISHLQKSKLITLDSNLFLFSPPVKLASLLRGYSSTTITSLDLYLCCSVDSNDLIALFETLVHSSITDLNLCSTEISAKAVLKLSKKLAKSKIEKLNLSYNKLSNEQLIILVNGLVNSKVTDLNIGSNRFSDFGPLFTRLKKTQIKMLNISSNSQLRHRKQFFPKMLSHSSLKTSSLTSLNLWGCSLCDEQGETLMERLTFSRFTKLDVGCNFLGLLTIKKFAVNVRDINLTDFRVSNNPLSVDGLSILANCLKDSKLVSLGVSNIGPQGLIAADHLFSFLTLTEGSPLRQIAMCTYSLPVWDRLAVCEPKMLINTAFTELDLSYSNIKNNVSNLITRLKFTAVAHLNLTGNRILDDDIAALAENLKETQIRRLNLDRNFITSQGAEALALSLRDSKLLYLHLNYNNIEDGGLKFLAENAKDTLVSVIDVSNNSGKKVLLIDKVLWRNKVAVHKLVSVFKQIAPRTDDNEFCFSQDCDDLDVSAFLEKCMLFYKTTIHDPRAIGVLLEEESVPFSREQIFKLVFEEFPRQFSEFIACQIEASVPEHVRILGKAEEMGLTAVVESLLIHRPVYMLDKEQGILHPYVYKLLLKYKQPICNLAVEPRGMIKIIEYFTEHADIEGAENVSHLLQNAEIS